MMTSVCGVDAGGTKTAAVLYDAAGRPLMEAVAGFGNLLNDEKQAAHNILEAAAGCVDGKPGIAVVVGAAGISSAENRQTLMRALQKRFPANPLTIVTDAMLMLYARLEGQNGMVLIAGTGSIAYGVKDGAATRLGGWGSLLDDRGSGYDIVRKSFVELTREYDRGEPFSLCSQALLDAWETDIFGAVRKIHSVQKGETAALLPVVVSAAGKGDVKAERRLREAGAALADMVCSLYRRIGFAEQVPVVPSGGVLEHVAPVRAAFENRLDSAEGIYLRENQNPASKGAYYIEKLRQERGIAVSG